MFIGVTLASVASTPEQCPNGPQAVHLERPHELCGGGLDSARKGRRWLGMSFGFSEDQGDSEGSSFPL